MIRNPPRFVRTHSTSSAVDTVIFEYESVVAHTRFVFFCVLFFCVLFFLRVVFLCVLFFCVLFFFLSRVPGFVLRFTSKFLEATICEGLRSPVPDPLELRWRMRQDGGQNKITRKRMALVEVGGKLNSY